MKVTTTQIQGVLVLSPARFEDSRGFFCETYNARAFGAIGIDAHFVQDNHVLSKWKGTLRGLHFQAPPHAQAKLVRAVRGAVWDVAVDLRPGRPTYGQCVGVELSADNGKQVFIPTGFAHGYLTLTDEAEVIYKVSDFYSPGHEAGIRWDDPVLKVPWPLDRLGTGRTPILSEKDAVLPKLDGLPAYF